MEVAPIPNGESSEAARRRSSGKAKAVERIEATEGRLSKNGVVLCVYPPLLVSIYR